MQPTPQQPTPDVSAEDVRRVVRRDFPEEQFGDVMALLDESGVERWHGGRYRVQLAALKLADGSLRNLRYAIEDAKKDYRDVLSAAEYPAYSREVSHTQEPHPDAKEQRRIVDEDWAQYQSWLNKSRSG